MPELLKNFVWHETGEKQFMLVECGRIVARDKESLAPKSGHPESDLGGAKLMPSFIDAHCHILPTGLDMQKLFLGECSSPEQVLDRVNAYHREERETEWLLAVHYDHTKFPTGDHLHRDQLDRITPTRPILLRHANGHAGVANSAALVAAGVREDVADPKGGVFVRDAAGRLTGVLLETAMEAVSNSIGCPPLEKMVEAILQAGEKMAEFGIACASDMMTGRYDLERELAAYRIAAERGCRIRTRLFLQWSAVFGPRAIPKERLHELAGALDGERCGVAGIKIFADGALSSGTAAIYGRFFTSPPLPNGAPDQDGQLIYAEDRLKNMVKTAHEAGYRIAIHSIGDRSTDLVMDAYENLNEPSRHRIEHAMLLSDAQIERMARLGIHCAMQPEFKMRFAHAYRRQLGEERASKLNRARSLLDAGIPLSFSSDRPIVPGDPWDGIRTATNRPPGFDPAENVTEREAIHAYTAMGAVANAEAAEMGELKPGQFADYQVVPTSRK